MDQYPLAKHFEEVAAVLKEQKSFKTTPGTDDLKRIYGLFKQATIGDVNTTRPGMFDFEGKAKWDAWESFKGVSQEAAKQQYVEFCRKFFTDDVAAKYN